MKKILFLLSQACLLVLPLFQSLNYAERGSLRNHSLNNINDVTIKTAYDPSGDEYTIVEGTSKYYIIHTKSNELVEYSLKSPSPYENYSNNLIYGGPGNYFYSDDSKYISTLNDNFKYSIDKVSNNAVYNSNVETQNNKKLQATDALLEQASVKKPNFFAQECDYECGYTDGGKCGYIGLGLMIGYADKYKNDSLMDDSYYNTLPGKFGLKNGTNGIGEHLYSLNPKSGTTSYSVQDTMNKYIKERNVTLKKQYCTFTPFYSNNDLFNAINNDIPVELFGNFGYSYDGTDEDGTANNHAIVAYGCDKLGGKYYWRCHLGWSSYGDVFIVSGMIGTIYYFDI